MSVIEPASVSTGWSPNLPEEQMRERRQSLGALTAEDGAQALVHCFAQHPHVLVGENLIRPLRQELP
jgi:NADP-dependent 3-hydroxy acid dehydrogenase YdfG